MKMRVPPKGQWDQSALTSLNIFTHGCWLQSNMLTSAYTVEQTKTPYFPQAHTNFSKGYFLENKDKVDNQQITSNM